MISPWSIGVLKIATVSLGLTLLASLGSQPSYNVPLSLLGLCVPHLPKPFLSSLLFVLLPITLILDITYLSIYGPYLSQGVPLFSLVMTVVNLFLKIPFTYYAFELMSECGGNPMVLLNPEYALGGGGGGVGGEGDRITDI